jgi:hypothetical protein
VQAERAIEPQSTGNKRFKENYTVINELYKGWFPFVLIILVNGGLGCAKGAGIRN